ncbi:hypothetical protein ALP65_100302 [Pseudomonas aeruginosa]|uniref:Uncharacterized protein n=1 Tax=Pseudomonas aeruginosa TaxID=287 RepID=A0A3M5DUP0_PSEAI|nr:hypothetical protein ALP65_100302 [Pseudomonas aeruginosa]
MTGMGMLSPLGLDVPSSWEGILAGRSGIAPIEHMDLSAYSTRFGGSVKGFNVEEYLSAKEARKLDLFIQYGLAASFQAVRDSGLEVTDANRERIGVSMGSGIGGLTNIENNCRSLFEQGPRRISPFFVPGSIINMVSGFLSIHLGLQGPNYALTTACTTGTHSIGMAARNIAYGEADVMVAGGSEMAACGLGLGGFGAARALSTRNDEPTRASRPWDRDRDGFVLSDGSGALVLEELEHARARYPAQLSGGMAQRTALARCLARQPKVLLLDEPFGALDEVTRADMQQLLLRAIHERGTAVVLITHDIDEALLLSERILLLGDSPARTLGEWRIDLPQPRAELVEELGALRIEILKTLRRASRTHAHPIAQPEASHVPGRPDPFPT